MSLAIHSLNFNVNSENLKNLVIYFILTLCYPWWNTQISYTASKTSTAVTVASYENNRHYPLGKFQSSMFYLLCFPMQCWTTLNVPSMLFSILINWSPFFSLSNWGRTCLADNFLIRYLSTPSRISSFHNQYHIYI